MGLRIIECPGLGGTHKHHGIRLMSPHRTHPGPWHRVTAGQARAPLPGTAKERPGEARHLHGLPGDKPRGGVRAAAGLGAKRGPSSSAIVPSPQLNPASSGRRADRGSPSRCRGGGWDGPPPRVPLTCRRCQALRIAAAPARGALRAGGARRVTWCLAVSLFRHGAVASAPPDVRAGRGGAGPGGGCRGGWGRAGPGRGGAAAEDGGMRDRAVLLLLPALLRRAGEPHPRGAGTAAAPRAPGGARHRARPGRLWRAPEGGRL